MNRQRQLERLGLTRQGVPDLDCLGRRPRRGHVGRPEPPAPAGGDLCPNCLLPSPGGELCPRCWQEVMGREVRE